MQVALEDHPWLEASVDLPLQVASGDHPLVGLVVRPLGEASEHHQSREALEVHPLLVASGVHPLVGLVVHPSVEASEHHQPGEVEEHRRLVELLEDRRLEGLGVQEEHPLMEVGVGEQGLVELEEQTSMEGLEGHLLKVA